MNDQERARRILEQARTIAVLGIHHESARPAAYVPQYLAEVGYRVLGVNAALVGRNLLGRAVVATVAELGERVDVVDVFRRAEAIGAHLEDLLAARPKAVWFQLGIRNDEAAAVLEKHGIEVIQDRCTLADHKRFGLPARPR
jgi:uncharacterized protein